MSVGEGVGSNVVGVSDGAGLGSGVVGESVGSNVVGASVSMNSNSVGYQG